MRDKKEFFNIIDGIDGKEFSAYSKLIGDFDFSRYVLKINQIPDKPDNDKTLFIVRVPQIISAFPPHLFNTPVRRTALEDLLTRKIAGQIESMAQFNEAGVSKRRFEIAQPGQKILPRTSMVITEEYVEARVYVSLPYINNRDKRAVSAEGCKDLFFEDLPEIVNGSLVYCNLDEQEVEEFVDLMEDADQIRQLLVTQGLVSFVSEGSMLSRSAGSDGPDFDSLNIFTVAEGDAYDIDVTNAGKVTGLGVSQGVTLILGSPYSGRKELVKAIASGIYNHIPGDGRELVVTVPDAVYVAAEPGRSIRKVDVSPFLGSAYEGADPSQYSAESADAFVSQAAATVESLEIGARVLVFDESDSDASFLSFDNRLAELTSDSEVKVHSLASRARQIADDLGVSLVIGGSSAVTELIPVADTILKVEGHEVRNITTEAKALAIQASTVSDDAARVTGMVEKSRWVIPSSIDPSAGKDDHYIEAFDEGTLFFGRSLIDLDGIEQIADTHQAETIGQIIYYAKLRYMDEGRPVREILDLIDRDLSTEGLDCLTREMRGDMVRPRRYEIAAALNRLDTLRISHLSD